MTIRELEPFAWGYCEVIGSDAETKIANGIYTYALYRRLYLEKNDFFAGFYDLDWPAGEKGRSLHRRHGARYEDGWGIITDLGAFDAEAGDYPELADELMKIKDAMNAATTKNIISGLQEASDKPLVRNHVCWGGGVDGGWVGHGNPDYTMLMEGGTHAMREKAEKYRAVNPGHDSFYDACEKTLEGLEKLAGRYRTRALELAADAEGKEKEQMLRIARAFERIPMDEPRDFFEACQMFWLVFTYNGIDSPGRIDQSMIKYWRVSDPVDRQKCLDELWILFRDTRTWNLCVGGSDEAGNDETNELSLAIIETAKKYGFETPNLTMRVHPGTSDEAWELAADTIATGIGMPVLYNDKCVVPALEKLGITPHDAHDYCMNGCNQIDIFGASHMGLEDGEVCLASCLELALHNGVHPKTNEFLTIETGDATKFMTYEEVWHAYTRQVEFACDRAVAMANMTQEVNAKYAPNPHRSCWIRGCLEKARDYRDSGPWYNHGQILTEGLADTADSLTALKKLVFEDKKYTMREVIEALDTDFASSPGLLRDISLCPKFGNDEETTNTVYREVLDHYYGYLSTLKTWRGGYYGGGLSTFDRTASYGCEICAMPNGKRRDSVLLADSIGAVPGCAHAGPTSLLNSVLSFDQTKAKSGHVMNLKFTRSTLQEEKGRKNFIAMAKAYFAKKGQQLSVNAVCSRELRDAQAHPELYDWLIVRVGGYSARFTQLSRDLQDNIIRRDEMPAD